MARSPWGRAVASVGLRPLYRCPYDRAYAETYWRTLAAAPPVDGYAPFESERRLLKIDLAFPLIYGGALAAGLCFSLRGLGYPAAATAAMLAVLLTVIADWTENLSQLNALSRFTAAGHAPASVLALANAATCSKTALVFVLVPVNLGAGLWLCVRALA
jgi:hypothetical protein